MYRLAEMDPVAEMDGLDDYIRRLVSRSGAATTRARQDLERELRAHFEDALEEARAEELTRAEGVARAEGHADARLLQIVRDRFGDPDEIAQELAMTWRFERGAISMAEAIAFLAISMVVVAALIWALQVTLAIASGISLSNAFPRLRDQMIGFGSLTLGYMGLYLEERLFRRSRLAKALLLNSALFSSLFTIMWASGHATSLAPVLAFVAGAAVRTLQQTVLRSAWWLGTAIPITVAWLGAGSLLSAGGHSPMWTAAIVRWTGLTFACYLLTLLRRRHEHGYSTDA